MPLALRGKQIPGRVERRVVADRGQNVVQLLVFGAGIARAVGRDERETGAPRQLDERLVAVLLLAQPVPPDLDVEPPGKDPGEPAERLPPRLEPVPRERPRERSLLAARQAMESRRVRRDLLERDARLSLGLAGRALRDEAAEVLVAGAVLDEESDSRRFVICDL